jgi:outer membrane protein assembly factor BamB
MSIQHGVLYALNARDGSERWEFQTQGSPVVGQVVDGQVYLFGGRVIGNGPNEESVFYAVDAATGQQRWPYPQNSAYLLGPVGVGNGLVFILSNAGNGLAMRELDALSTSSGSLRWKAPIEQNYVQAFYDNGVITIGMEGAITTYRASDGQLLSNTPIAKGDYLTLVANGVFYVVASNNLLAVDARSGKELWRYTGLGVDVKAVANGLVYTTIVKGSAQPGDSSDKVDSAIAALDASTGKVRWTYDIGQDAVDALIVK